MGKKKAAKGGADAGDASGGGDGAEAARAAAAATPSAAASGADVVPPTDANGDPEQADDERDTRKGEDAKQAAGLSRMTDYVETRELDSAKAARAMQSIFSEEKSTQDREAEIARERELAAVEINPADVELVASEMELDKAIAERKLRENRGDVVKTLVSLVEA